MFFEGFCQTQSFTKTWTFPDFFSRMIHQLGNPIEQRRNMYDPSQKTPEMKINVSLGEFHSTHSTAYEAKGWLNTKGVKNLSVPELEEALRSFRAGQYLSDNEDCEHAEDVPSYTAEIRAIEAELETRKGPTTIAIGEKGIAQVGERADGEDGGILRI